jgi:hypothetical protein
MWMFRWGTNNPPIESDDESNTTGNALLQPNADPPRDDGDGNRPNQVQVDATLVNSQGTMVVTPVASSPRYPNGGFLVEVERTGTPRVIRFVAAEDMVPEIVQAPEGPAAAALPAAALALVAGGAPNPALAAAAAPGPVVPPAARDRALVPAAAGAVAPVPARDNQRIGNLAVARADRRRPGADLAVVPPVPVRNVTLDDLEEIPPRPEFRGSGLRGTLVLVPLMGHTWINYFSEDGCFRPNHQITQRIDLGAARLKTKEEHYGRQGANHMQAVSRSVARFLTQNRFPARAKWGALVQYLRDDSRQNQDDHVWTNRDIHVILTGEDINLDTIDRLRTDSFAIIGA